MSRRHSYICNYGNRSQQRFKDEDVQKRAILIIQGWGEFKPYREIIPLYYEKYKELKFRGVANPYNWFKGRVSKCIPIFGLKQLWAFVCSKG